jgi:hypothetical protein
MTLLHDAPKFAQIAPACLPSRNRAERDPETRCKYLPDSLGKELVKPAITPI